MSIKTLELEIRKRELDRIIAKERHEYRIQELNLKKEIVRLKYGNKDK